MKTILLFCFTFSACSFSQNKTIKSKSDEKYPCIQKTKEFSDSLIFVVKECYTDVNYSELTDSYIVMNLDTVNIIKLYLHEFDEDKANVSFSMIRQISKNRFYVDYSYSDCAGSNCDLVFRVELIIDHKRLMVKDVYDFDITLKKRV